jgi:formylglycine-generating enzyme required for sulfatase activity
MKKLITICAVVVTILAISGAAQAAMDFVTVGNPGNTGELSGGPGYGFAPQVTVGAVGYDYKMGKYEVTAGQYTEFLNAVASTTDPYGLYNTRMGQAGYAYMGCNIQRSGSSGNYNYTVASDWANRPVNYVSWGDAARFANWMTSGQTEIGSYTLNGAMTDAALMAVTRNASAQYVIPTEDEWYKAAYYDPLKVGGPGYWDYIKDDTQPNSVPNGNGYRDVTETVLISKGHNLNYSTGSWMLDTPPYYERTEVGTFFLSDSPYGTFDQLGNVSEWNEAILLSQLSGTNERGVRGGTYGSTANSASALFRGSASPTYEGWGGSGFRIAEVPEPGTLVLLSLAGLSGLAMVWIRRRRLSG